MEALMLQTRVNQALSIRRDALRYLRRGDRQMHRLMMRETRLPLLQARQWKVKQ
jgi:hypothetical protein